METRSNPTSGNPASRFCRSQKRTSSQSGPPIRSPTHDGPEETVEVFPPGEQPLEIERGIKARTALLSQTRAARAAIERHQPERIVTLGGACLIDLAPMAYLNRR